MLLRSERKTITHSKLTQVFVYKYGVLVYTNYFSKIGIRTKQRFGKICVEFSVKTDTQTYTLKEGSGRKLSLSLYVFIMCLRCK